ncbi:MAG: signal recognition particle-docking protein FtsY [Planctomycetes bacterium]|nr:signal recognition particle-docking protein FtsY [Planctomycetota bacterium]
MVFGKLFGRKEGREDREGRKEREGGEEAGGREGARPDRPSLFARALGKTRAGLRNLFSFRGRLDESAIGEIEAQLYATDLGPDVVDALLDGPEGVRQAWKDREIHRPTEILDFLRARLKAAFAERARDLIRAPQGPTVVLVAGVNGTGKTTTIAKLAHLLRRTDERVIVAAADTFRAAAVEQLEVWCGRVGVPLIKGKAKGDPGAVAYEGANRAIADAADWLIVDTAGRLHTQKNLMQELAKVQRVLAGRIDGAPHEVLLVVDATTGQNAISQTAEFGRAIRLTGLVLTKLDGTAKGGIVVALNNRFEVPVKFVGVGEGLEDLEPFDPIAFVDALFS